MDFGKRRLLAAIADSMERVTCRYEIRARGHFLSDDAAAKLLYLIVNRSENEWKIPPREWSMAKAQFAVVFGEHFIRAMAA